MKEFPKFDLAEFKVSSFCHHSSHCVKIAQKNNIIAIADSKNLNKEPLFLTKKNGMILLLVLKIINLIFRDLLPCKLLA